jgi:hypothetical protein
VRSKDLVAASRDLFISSKDSFINTEDLLIIFDTTNRININNCILLLINRSGEDF